MESLIEGYRRFRATGWQEHRRLFKELAARGQSPRAMVITCADSRLDPQLIFGTAPGEVFVVRNVANLVPPYAPDSAYHGTSAALEFAVRVLKVEHVIVLGHAQCGGIGALLRGAGEGGADFVDTWMKIATPARERALLMTGGDPERAQTLCEHEAIKVSLEHLMTFPWIRERVESGSLALHGWYFGIESGELLRLDKDGKFRAV
ncbi:MAG TPA: carbonic anhydrase [Alphaproteobacteria bacterium]|nr:carbonic anhydrase [Alphaproteobacteria bacterium]